ncbi:unnamed protein product [Natator depressus]
MPLMGWDGASVCVWEPGEGGARGSSENPPPSFHTPPSLQHRSEARGWGGSRPGGARFAGKYVPGSFLSPPAGWGKARGGGGREGSLAAEESSCCLKKTARGRARHSRRKGDRRGGVGGQAPPPHTPGLQLGERRGRM